jgi:hypothetical protein
MTEVAKETTQKLISCRQDGDIMLTYLNQSLKWW